MIQYETERESLEVFYAMREELHFYLNRTLLLETILAANDIPIPEYDDCSLALSACSGWQSLLLADSFGRVANYLRRPGSKTPCRWCSRSNLCRVYSAS